jgi:hypothetical protein
VLLSQPELYDSFSLQMTSNRLIQIREKLTKQAALYESVLIQLLRDAYWHSDNAVERGTVQ